MPNTSGTASSWNEHRRRLYRSLQEMGYRKAPQVLRHLKVLAPDVPDEFLRTNWTSRLPPQVQAILAGYADGSYIPFPIFRTKPSRSTPQQTTASISPAAPHSTASLPERVEELSSKVASLPVQQTYSHSQSTFSHSSQSTGRHHSTTDYVDCRPDLGSPSMDVRLDLKRLYHS